MRADGGVLLWLWQWPWVSVRGLGAQSCSRGLEGPPRAVWNSYFSVILPTGLWREGPFSLHFRKHKTCPSSLVGLGAQPGPVPLLSSFEPEFWKTFWGSQKKWTPLPHSYSLRKCLQKQENAGPKSYAFWGGGKERDQCLGLSKNIFSLWTEWACVVFQPDVVCEFGDHRQPRFLLLSAPPLPALPCAWDHISNLRAQQRKAVGVGLVLPLTKYWVTCANTCLSLGPSVHLALGGWTG